MQDIDDKNARFCLAGRLSTCLLLFFCVFCSMMTCLKPATNRTASYVPSLTRVPPCCSSFDALPSMLFHGRLLFRSICPFLIARFLFQDLTNVVTCGQYQNCFEEATLAGLNNCLNGGTHGPVHIKIGGEWNNPEQQLAVDLGTVADVGLRAMYQSVPCVFYPK